MTGYCVDNCPDNSGPIQSQTGVNCPTSGCGAIEPDAPTKQIAFYCIPGIAGAALGTLTTASQKTLGGVYEFIEENDGIQNMFQDSGEVKWIIIGSIGIAFLLAFLYMIFVRIFAGPIIWITMLFALICLLGLTYFSYKYADDKKQEIEDLKAIGTQDTSAVNRKRIMGEIAMWTCAVLSFIYIIFILCTCHSIREVIGLFKTAAMFVKATPYIVFVPVIT